MVVVVVVVSVLVLSLVLLLLVPSRSPRLSSHSKYVLVISMFFLFRRPVL